MDDIKNIKEENDVDQIIVKYDDGTERVIRKGAVIEYKEEGEEGTLTFEFVDISGKELTSIIYGATEMGVKMGMFED